MDDNGTGPALADDGYSPEEQTGGRRRRRVRKSSKSKSNMWFKNFLSKKMRSKSKSKRSKRMTRRR